MTNLETAIDELRRLSLHLIPHTYPQVHFLDDLVIDCLRQRVVIVDGYEIGLYFIRSDLGVCHQEVLEIISIQSPFLPRYLVCKIAARFLGCYGLFYSEKFKSGRKAYVWSVKVDSNGHPLMIDNQNVLKHDFEGFQWLTATEDNSWHQ